jgi:hypothetical protein
MAISIDDIESLLRLLDEHPEWVEALQERLVNEKVLLRLLEQRAELREAARRLLLGEEFLQMPALMRQLAETQQQQAHWLQQNTEILQRHDARIAHLEELTVQLVEIGRQNTEQLRQHAVMIQHILEVQEQLLREVHDLRDWRRGEEGRRAGERYERNVVKRAPRLLNGGEGGTTSEPHVRQRLTQWLQSLWRQEPDEYPEDEDDPILADLIWWKGDRVAVIEVSLKVNGLDVMRARQRADVLRRAGVDAIPMVIGEEWATPESRMLAEQNAVEWMLKGDLSPGFIAFRRMTDGQVLPEQGVNAN